MPYDKMEKESLLEYDIYRRKHYPFTFYCPKCNRSFVSKKEEKECKFCQGSIKAVTGHRLNIYFCEHCDRRIETEEIKMACSICGNTLKTLYRWDMLQPAEKRMIKLAKIIRSLKIPKIKISKKESKEKKKEVKKEKTKYKGEELPTK